MAKANHSNIRSIGTDVEVEEPERSAEDIRHDIAATRQSITNTVEELNDRFQETLDWRTYVSRHPMVAVGVAVGVGFVISGVFKPRPTPMERIQDAVAETVENFSGQLRHQFDGVVPTPTIGKMVRAAATGWLVKAAADFLSQKIVIPQKQNSIE